MPREAGKTGAGPTAAIAIEQYFPSTQRVVTDDLAYRLLPLGTRAFVALMRCRSLRDMVIRRSERDIPGMWNGMLCRKRYIDELLSAPRCSFDAAVNLGAGFDTRAYRLPALADIHVWEVDQPASIRKKEGLVKCVFGTVPANVHLSGADFDREDPRGM